MKSSRIASSLVTAALVVIPLFPGRPGQAIKDDLGISFKIPAEPPQRIISLAPNITEVLFALGLGDKVVGVTRFCDYPEQARSLRKIGGLVDPNIEIIHSLEPDLVIGFRGNPLRFLGRLRDFNFPVFVLDIGTDLGSLFTLIEKLGLITGTHEAAERLNGGMRTRVDAVEMVLSGVKEKPRVFVMLYGQGLWTCGADSYLDNLISRAGAVNVAGWLPRKWFLYSRERLVRDAPERIVILAKSKEDFHRARRLLMSESAYSEISAVKTGAVFHLDENAASRFGPRLVGVLENLARILHPERFGGSP